ncbi:PIG-L family deacetylase [Streptomyces sp. WAC06614]|uniref:PIG-L family deacetylase n=1 Tax=Streptomyces sp. WAC06614 TaxID=2487416 RepID=UPI000F794F1A|nr:PIG-L family deacetylase [Streptomyces sp. WAC06614]RSS80614.1 hypothetical protein EF918_13135 [Streptomyces sp. WAC06614]
MTSARSTVHIVAHQDDDLYFMNPDLVRSLQGGDRVATVVLTAGEGDGINVDTNDPERSRAVPDHAGYSAARGCGLRSAYARMATGDRTSPWRREAVAPVPGFVVERCTLLARPDVRLYFCQLHMGAFQAGGAGARTRVFELWDGTVPLQPTLPAPGSPVTEVQYLDRETVIAGLAALLAELRPTVVRTLDPDPEHDGGKEDYVQSDHPDHTAAAEFTMAALQRHRATDAPDPAVEYYRAYANRFWGYNLDRPELDEKADYLGVYAGLGAGPCPDGVCAACGDHQLGPNPYRSTHMNSCSARYSPATGWLRLGPGGRLNAFAVLAGRPVFWTETAPGAGTWWGPYPLAQDGWFAPSLAVTGLPGGPAHVVALRRRAPHDDTSVPELVHLEQDEYGQGFTDWIPLGNPDAGHPDGRRARELGVPLATVDGAGRLHVFARDFAQGVAMRRQDHYGGWRPWERLGGRFVQDAGVAHTTQAGTVEVYVPGKNSVYRWYQSEPGGEFHHDSTLKTGTVATGGITAVDSGGGRTALYFREAGTQQVMAYRQHETGLWPGGPAGVGGAGGTGAIAALWTPGRGARDIFLAHRSAGGRLTLSLPFADKDVPGPRWRESGEPFVHAPALALDAAGHLVAAVLGADGRLHVRRALGPQVGSPLGPDHVI